MKKWISNILHKYFSLVIYFSGLLFFLLVLIFLLVFVDFEIKDYFKSFFYPLFLQPLIISFILKVEKEKFKILNNDKLRVKLNDKDLKAKFHFYQNKNKFLSTPFKKEKELPIVIEHIPKKKTLIQDLSCTLMNDRYNLPSVISNNSNKILSLNKQYQNALTLRLQKIETTRNIKLFFQVSDYINHTITNNSPDVSIEGKTIREYLEPGPLLHPLEIAKPSNHLGINLLTITKEGFIIIPQRNTKVSMFKGMYSPSVSGALNWSLAIENDKISLKKAIFTESDEELSPKITKSYGDIYFMGITRELARLGKPEIFFVTRLDLTVSAIKKRLLSNKIVALENQQIDFVSLKDILKKWKETPQLISSSLEGALSLYSNHFLKSVPDF